VDGVIVLCKALLLLLTELTNELKKMQQEVEERHRERNEITDLKIKLQEKDSVIGKMTASLHSCAKCSKVKDIEMDNIRDTIHGIENMLQGKDAERDEVVDTISVVFGTVNVDVTAGHPNDVTYIYTHFSTIRATQINGNYTYQLKKHTTDLSSIQQKE
jgi:hypothetical protein